MMDALKHTGLIVLFVIAAFILHLMSSGQLPRYWAIVMGQVPLSELGKGAYQNVVPIRKTME